MLQRIASVIFFALALTASARGETGVAPNRPAEIDVVADAETPAAAPAPVAAETRTPAASEEDRRIRAIVERLPDKTVPAEIPVKREAAAPPPAMKAAETPVNLLAAPVSDDPKESLALGRGPSTSGGAETGKSTSSWVFTTLTALGVVIGLILLLRAGFAKLTGRTTASANNPVVEVLSRTSIAPKNHVLLLRLGRRILVVGDSSSGMNTLANIDDPEEVASLLQAISVTKPGSVSAEFTQLMQGFDGKYESEESLPEQGRDTGEADLDRARDTVSGLAARLRSMAAREGA
jgi:flagellar biogenesis protein FliO